MAHHARLRIRQADAEDGPELARLRIALSTELYDPTDDPGFEHAFTEWWQTACVLGDWTAVVADAGGRLVADAWVRRVGKVPQPGRRDGAIGYLTNVYVEPEYRATGLGSILVSAALERARQDGCQRVVVWPARSSGTFFRRLGFAAPPDALVHDLG